jgi:hypothetical protein
MTYAGKAGPAQSQSPRTKTLRRRVNSRTMGLPIQPPTHGTSMKLLPALLLLCAFPLSVVNAQDLPRANALEEAAVRALLGKKAIITGKVTDAFESPKGMTFLNLEGGKFTLVAWKDSYEKFEGGSPAKLYKDKVVEVTGEVFEFRPKGASKDDPGKLEIKLSSPEQIRILTDSTPAPEADPKAADKKPPAKTEKPKKDGSDPKDKKDPKPAEEPKTDKTDRVDPKKYFK